MNLVFLHIPKSGGTSFKHTFSFVNQRQHHETPHFYRVPSSSLEYVCVLRNPIHRCWSHYRHALRTWAKLKGFSENTVSEHETSEYERFMSYHLGKHALQNTASRMICGHDNPTLDEAIEQLDKFFYVLDFNNFDEECVTLSHLINNCPTLGNQLNQKIARVNTTPHPSIPSDIFCEMVIKYNDVDLPLYKYFLNRKNHAKTKQI